MQLKCLAVLMSLCTLLCVNVSAVTVDLTALASADSSSHSHVLINKYDNDSIGKSVLYALVSSTNNSTL